MFRSSDGIVLSVLFAAGCFADHSPTDPAASVVERPEVGAERAPLLAGTIAFSVVSDAAGAVWGGFGLPYREPGCELTAQLGDCDLLHCMPSPDYRPPPPPDLDHADAVVFGSAPVPVIEAWRQVVFYGDAPPGSAVGDSVHVYTIGDQLPAIDAALTVPTPLGSFEVRHDRDLEVGWPRSNGDVEIALRAFDDASEPFTGRSELRCRADRARGSTIIGGDAIARLAEVTVEREALVVVSAIAERTIEADGYAVLLEGRAQVPQIEEIALP